MRLIIHIGTPKAGSSSLQVALDANRSMLLKRGILYPAIGRASHHTDLASGLHVPGRLPADKDEGPTAQTSSERGPMSRADFYHVDPIWGADRL